jgi:hypothetical protein
MKRLVNPRVEGPAARGGAAAAGVSGGWLVSYVTDGFGWLSALIVALGLFVALGSRLPERAFATRAGALLDSEWRLGGLAIVLFVASFIVAGVLGASAGFVTFALAAVVLVGAAARASARRS